MLCAFTDFPPDQDFKCLRCAKIRPGVSASSKKRFVKKSRGQFTALGLCDGSTVAELCSAPPRVVVVRSRSCQEIRKKVFLHGLKTRGQENAIDGGRWGFEEGWGFSEEVERSN